MPLAMGASQGMSDYQSTLEICVMCGNIEWHANGLTNALQTPNQCLRAPTNKDGNPVEVGLMVRIRSNSARSPLSIQSCISTCMHKLNNKVQCINYS